MRRESPKMGCGHRPVGGLFALPRVPNEARVRLTLKRRFFFGRNVGARCSLAAEKGACGGQRGGPRPGRSGWRASSRGGRGPVNARFWGPSSASCSMEVRSAHNGLLTGRAMASRSCHRAVPTPRSEWAASWSHSGRSGGCKPGLLAPGGLGCGDRNSRGPEPSPHWVGE